MKYQFLFFLFSLTFCSFSYGQTDASNASRNNAYLEALGNGGLYSINYERLIVEHSALRVGFAWWEEDFGRGTTSFITVPVLASRFFGKRKSKLELGGGFLLGRKKFTSSFGGTNYISSIFHLTSVIGYRYQPSTAGFMFRAGVTPFYALKGADPTNFLSVGLSIGYSF